MSEQLVRKVKLCPFRKEIVVTDTTGLIPNPTPMRYEEQFMECLGEECIAYGYRVPDGPQYIRIDLCKLAEK